MRVGERRLLGIRPTLPPHAIPSSRARASFVCARRCSFSRGYPLLAMPAPSWRSPALSYTRCTPSLRDRGLSVPTPSPFSPASSFCCRCSVSAGSRETLRYDLHATVRRLFILARAESEPPCTGTHCLSSYRGFLSSLGLFCVRASCSSFYYN